MQKTRKPEMAKMRKGNSGRKPKKGKRTQREKSLLLPKEGQLYSDSIRSAMADSYPRTQAQRLREAAKSVDDLPVPPPQKLLRKLMSTGHVGSMGTRSLMRPFKVRRHIYSNGFMTSGTGGVGVAYKLELDQLNGFTDFTTLFDQYRFTKFHYTIIPRQNVMSFAESSVTATAVAPHLMSMQDPDDITTPTEGNMLEHQETVITPFGKTTRGSFKPRAAIAAYSSVFTSFADFDGWCDCASDDIQWYALKIWSTATAPTQTEQQIWDAFFTIDCEFRFVH